ncbi:endopeptidase La [uncultured Pigmentiphaga sp.]|uniref:endopeptidase La n=1 Tax=uncultured Pigmentiphaga sp. TaxID=340361 RepID=UPI00260C93BC|nr:endopeptidase La [uncultured Pigmentiphaga sp.]
MENEFRDRQPEQEAPAQSAGAPASASSGAATIELPSDALALIPVRNLVLFPGLVAPIAVGREGSVRAAQNAARTNRQVGVILQRSPDVEEPQGSDLHEFGTVANILRYVTTPDGAHHVICQGVQRFRIIELLEGFPFLVARVQRFEDPEITTSEIEARLIQLKTKSQEVLQLLPQAPAELSASIQNMTSTPVLSDFIAGLMEIKPQEKQEVLETVDVIARADKVLALLAHQIEVLRISRDIDQQTKARFEDRQREVMLREQLKTIQQELGEVDGNSAELAELSERITKAQMPEEAEKQARKELKRLERIPEASTEYSMIRTYLDWLIELPWSVSTEDRIDIAEARRILDEDHYGLEKIKRRILEYLAVRKLNPNGKSPVLCFAGPPGVGKTSLGQSIAKATGRKFVRLSLGGVHDEAEIRGHRRTYIGALPGNVIQALHKAGANNCVMMLDEVDKLGASVQGDPAAALLEVLDPEQNNTFRDNYLGVPFDLSRVLFIATANVLDSIPGPLRDRMEVISLPGYTEEEKAQIARRYLVPRQLEANGLRAEQCEITDAAIREVINGYTREAGVRNLEREIGSAFRHAAMSIAEGTAEHVRIDVADLHTVLGPRRYESEIAMRTGLPGVATGLAWTPVGGDILFIEASRTPGSGKLILTGQLGEVMRESAQAALTLLKARAASLNIDASLFERNDIHVHVPAGAIPKDGPSAGVAMFIALSSLMTDTPVPPDRAMTGEISLRGLVLPVGGIKEKVLAALRAGIKTVMLPARNRKDVDDIPEDSRKQLQFIFLETVEDALRAVATTEAKGEALVE